MNASLTATLAAALLLAPAAMAAPPPPPGGPSLCGQASVLQEVADLVTHAGQHASIEPGSAGQAPGRRPGEVLCGVRLHTWIYDTRLSRRPFDQVTVFQYALELGHNGVFLRPAGF